ncbi:MAG: caspase family protein [Nitrospirae bacterium]|nr:caspase family protein [Nitrospirota bacterium]
MYSDVVAKVLTDDGASKDNILDGFKWIQEKATDKDVAMIFMSGHGESDKTGYYYAPVDVDSGNFVSSSDIIDNEKLTRGKLLFFLDTCHSGNVVGVECPNADLLIKDLARVENGFVVFTSSTGSQESEEDVKWHNSSFTKALIDGLKGKAVHEDSKKIMIEKLGSYISRRIKQFVNNRQTPVFLKPQTITDFPIAVKR